MSEFEDHSKSDKKSQEWSVFGHDQNKERFNKIIERNSFSHAYIFEGPSNIGKTTFSIDLASKIIGDEQMMSRSMIHISDSTIGIEQIRTIEKKIAIRGIRGENRVILISDADNMTIEAQNAFLKTLEEPQDKVVIIMTVSSSRKLLPTIVSRCQKVWFSPFRIRKVKSYLKKSIDTKLSDELSVLSGGAIGKAIELAENKEKLNELKSVLRIMSDTKINKMNWEGAKEMNKKEAISFVSKVILILRIVFLTDRGVIDKKEVDEVLPKSLFEKNLNKTIFKIKMASFIKKALERNANIRFSLENLFLSI